VVRPDRASRLAGDATEPGTGQPGGAELPERLTTRNAPAGGFRIGGRDVVLVLWLGALFAGTWPLLHTPLGQPGSPLPLVAHVSGMLAGYGVLVLLLLMARTPALEQGLGADVLARWHAWGGRLVVGLVLVHAWAATVAWAESRRQGAALSTWHVLSLPGLAAATAATVLMVLIAVISARTARRRIRHERWHGLHLLMYPAVALGFAHQLAGPDLVRYRLLQVAWALAYIYTFAIVLRHRVLAPLRQAARHRLRVAGVRTESPDVVTIVVEGEHLEELRAEAGQFFRWRFLTPDHWLNAHPFSLSAPPSSTSLRLTVKALGDGSRSLQRLPAGTWVIAEGPYGAVTSARRSHRNVVLIAGGVGITPMRALFEILPLQPGDDLVLLYGRGRRTSCCSATSSTTSRAGAAGESPTYSATTGTYYPPGPSGPTSRTCRTVTCTCAGRPP
jgi:predicted ferric reductase